LFSTWLTVKMRVGGFPSTDTEEIENLRSSKLFARRVECEAKVFVFHEFLRNASSDPSRTLSC